MRSPRALGAMFLGVALCVSSAVATGQPTRRQGARPAVKKSRAASPSVGKKTARAARRGAVKAGKARVSKGKGRAGRLPPPKIIDAAIDIKGPPPPAGSYESLAAKAQRMGNVARTLEPFTEHCNEQRDMTRRQCVVVRSYLRKAIAKKVFRGTVEKGALKVGPFQLGKKGRTISLSGCVACRRPVPGDRPHYLGVRPGKGAAGQIVGKVKIPHASAHVAKIWQNEVGSKLRAELLYQVGPPAGGKGGRGLALKVLGYRVFDRCTGEVVMSKPSSAFKAKVAAGQKDCVRPKKPVAATQPGGPQPDPSWPYVLSVGDIRRGMNAVRGQVYACYLQFQIPGVAELEVEVGGMDGTPKGVKVQGKFDDTPTGACISHAVGLARFPKFRAASMKVPYRFYLR